MYQDTSPISPAPTPERLPGEPAIMWATIARAERLAYAGAGWSVDHVLRKALALLEREHFAPEEARA